MASNSGASAATPARSPQRNETANITSGDSQVDKLLAEYRKRLNNVERAIGCLNTTHFRSSYVAFEHCPGRTTYGEFLSALYDATNMGLVQMGTKDDDTEIFRLRVNKLDLHPKS